MNMKCKDANEIIPIIIVHRGANSYLKYVIKQAEKSGNLVYLLGDDSNRHMCKNWYSIYDYSSEKLKIFQDSYVHMSSLDKQFELFCFERHFYIYEFAIRNGFDDIVMMDSDVMLYKKNVTQHFKWD